MMSTTITFLIQSTICWSVLLLFYHLCLRKTTHYHLSRIYLLASLFLGFFIPLLPNFHSHAPEFIYTFQGQVDQFVVVVDGYSNIETHSAIHWTTILQICYITISLGLIVNVVRGIYRIYSIRPVRQSKNGAVDIVYHRESIQPFSFLNKIFIPENYPQEYLEVVTAHELSHIEQGHSVDILCSRIARAVLWVNPLIYLFDAYLKEVHEHFADKKILSEYDYKTYQRALRFSAFQSLGLSMAHAFNCHNILKRLSQMKKNKSTKSTKLLYVAILPIIIILSMAMNSFDNLELNNSEVVQNVQEEIRSNPIIGADHMGNFAASDNDTIPPEAPPSPPPILNESVPPPPPPPPPTEGEIVKVADEFPRFPGCEMKELSTEERQACAHKKLIEFLSNHIQYPEGAKKNGVDGTVVIQFIVSKVGMIENARIVRDVNHGCGEEALRVVNLMNEMAGQWTPGKLKDKAVNVQYNLPVRFKLDANMKENDAVKLNAEKASVYKEVEQMPRFPGCEHLDDSDEARATCAQNKMLEFLMTNISYPQNARKKGTEGTVIVKFVIDVDGSIDNAKILRSVGDGCDEEALRVVNLMNQMEQAWIPGKQKGQAVKVQYVLPIKFKVS